MRSFGARGQHEREEASYRELIESDGLNDEARLEARLLFARSLEARVPFARERHHVVT